LKIVDGPMKGAEIALVEGLRLKVGSGDVCDIVLADGSLAEVAFELDVTADAVTFIRGDETKVLEPTVVQEVGTSGIAVGPADSPWEPLVKPHAEEAVPPPPPPAAGESPAADAESAPQPAPETADAASADAPETQPPRRSHRLLWLLVILLLLGGAAFALWYFWPRVTERFPQTETARVAVVDAGRTACGWTHQACGTAWAWTCRTCQKMAGTYKPPAPPVVPGPTLAEIARQHGLVLTESPLCLKGNFSRRTERLAVRALALAADSRVRLDLTDDETLKASASELLFVVTEGAVKATAATNRVVTLAGFAPSRESFERTVRALNADVKGIERLVTGAVRIGGVPPPKAGESSAATSKNVKSAPRSKGTRTPAEADYPIAGILTVPYRCVVLRNGMRLAEGGQIGNAVIERIEADRLVLKAGATTFEWKP